MSQTTAKSTMAVAFPGMLADNTNLRDCRSLINVEAGAEVPFGVVVCEIAGAQQAELPDEAGDNFELAGVVVHSHSYAPGLELGTVGLKAGAVMSVLNRGRIYVLSETAAAKGDRGHVRIVAGAGGTQLGAIRNAAVGGETIDATKAIRYMETISAPGLVIVEVDFQNELD